MKDVLQFRILISIKEDNLRGLNDTSQEALRAIVQKNNEITVQTADSRHREAAADRRSFSLATSPRTAGHYDTTTNPCHSDRGYY